MAYYNMALKIDALGIKNLTYGDIDFIHLSKTLLVNQEQLVFENKALKTEIEALKAEIDKYKPKSVKLMEAFMSHV